MSLGNLVRFYREQAGLTKNELARASGLDPTQVGRLEGDMQKTARPETITKLVLGLGLSLNSSEAKALFEAAGIPLSAIYSTAKRQESLDLEVSQALHELRILLEQALKRVTQLEDIIQRNDI